MKSERTNISVTDSLLEHEIEAIVSVEPSPEFVSRVRTHIARQPVPFWTMGWTSLAAASAVMAVVVGVVVSRPDAIVQPESIGSESAASARTDTKIANASAAGTRANEVPTPPRVNSRTTSELRKTPVSKVALPEPEFLIDPRAAEAMRRFLSHPQPERVELTFATIEPQPLPEFKMAPLPMFDPMAALQGDFR